MRMEGTGNEMYLPPGFRFHPTDEELLVQYLLPKTSGLTFSSNVIADVHLYRHDPWDLPGKAFFGDNEWYFFSQRHRKFPNGSRPNRGAGSGFWKATGTDKTIVANGRKVGTKKALVFYVGKPPNGSKTNWIMHEYQLLDDNGRFPQKKATRCLDDWVLCRIYKKQTGQKKGMQRLKQHDEVASSPSDGETFASLSADGDQSSKSNVNQWTAVQEMNADYQQQQLTYSSDFNIITDDFFMNLPTYMAGNCISIAEKTGGNFSTPLIDAFYFQNHQQEPYSFYFQNHQQEPYSCLFN
ncbi:NAC domain-containing protein 67-like [Nymphaea colorata]|nr:NAC domain-containing protein 67-like [Nymphaea colorata]